MDARLLQLPGPGDVGLFVEAGLELDEDGDLLAPLGRPDERFDDGAVARRAVQRLLDRQHLGVDGGPLDEGLDGVGERFVRVVHEHVLLGDDREDVDRAVLHAHQPAGRGGHEGRFLQVRALQAVEAGEAAEVEETVEHVDTVGAEVELPLEQVAHLVGRPGVDLQADRVPEAAPAELHLHGGEQVVGFLVDHGEVGVPGHPERVVGLDLHAREERGEMGADHLLERDETVPRRSGDEPGEQRRHLHPGEPALVPQRVTDEHRQVQRQVGDVRERVPGVDRQRREDREDVVVEEPGQLFAV